MADEFPQWALVASESWETAHTVIVRLELPGLTREDIEVSFTPTSLKVRGEKRSEAVAQARTYHLMERAFGKFERTITLPHDIDSQTVEIAYQDGILTVIAQKTETTPPAIAF